VLWEEGTAHNVSPLASDHRLGIDDRLGDCEPATPDHGKWFQRICYTKLANRLLDDCQQATIVSP
jgi:hypothetical protein